MYIVYIAKRISIFYVVITWRIERGDALKKNVYIGVQWVRCGVFQAQLKAVVGVHVFGVSVNELSTIQRLVTLNNT